MKHLPAKRRKAALRTMSEEYAERRVADDCGTEDLGPLMEGFEDGYRQAMKDARAAYTNSLDGDGFRLWTDGPLAAWLRPLK